MGVGNRGDAARESLEETKRRGRNEGRARQRLGAVAAWESERRAATMVVISPQRRRSRGVVLLCGLSAREDAAR